MRPSGRLTRLMNNTDYQVANKPTKKNRLKRVYRGQEGELPRRKTLHIAPAPLEFLPDHAKERGLGQRGQRQRSFRLANGNDRSAFDVYRLFVRGQLVGS